MWGYFIPAGGGCGLVTLVILFFFGSGLVNIFSPVASLYRYIVEPPEALQQKYLQPVLAEIIKVPYEELNEKEQKFIITVDGKELLVTYYLDNNWFTGYKLGMWGGIKINGGKVQNNVTREEDVARKITVEIEPHKPQTKEDDFHPFVKNYAAVPDGDWYVLTPFDEFEDEELDKEDSQEPEVAKQRKAEQEQKELEEDAKIRRAN